MSFQDDKAVDYRLDNTAQERMLYRATFLDDQDQILVKLAVQDGVSHRQLARLVGVPPGSLSRRLHRLANRLHDPLVIALVEHPDGLRPEVRQLGIEHFLQARSLCALADLHRMPQHQVAHALGIVRGWFDAVHYKHARRGRVISDES
jgi:hypothetical protein